MMHIEEGEKHSFWADSLPAGLSIVRQFDKLVALVWVLCMVAYMAVFLICRQYTDYDLYLLLSYVGVPFAVVGAVYIIDRKNIVAIVIMVVMAVAAFIIFNSFLYILVVAYLFIGSLGVACVVDAFQRAIFYDVVSHIRYVNVKDRLGIKDRVYGFMFNIPPDLDTRNITINPKKLGKFPWKDMGSTIMLSLVVGMFFWIYLSMNPSFMGSSAIGGEVPMFIYGVTLYIPVIVLPFSVFKSLDVKIGTSYRDFRLYNGAIATVKRMAIPIFAALIYVLLAMNKKDPMEVLLFIGLSASVILFVVILTSIIYYYVMEAATSADIAKKWKIFIPVPLMMNLDEEAVRKEDVCPGIPVRDENDMSDIDIEVRRIN